MKSKISYLKEKNVKALKEEVKASTFGETEDQYSTGAAEAREDHEVRYSEGDITNETTCHFVQVI